MYQTMARLSLKYNMFIITHGVHMIEKIQCYGLFSL